MNKTISILKFGELVCKYNANTYYYYVMREPSSLEERSMLDWFFNYYSNCTLKDINYISSRILGYGLSEEDAWEMSANGTVNITVLTKLLLRSRDLIKYQ